MAQVDIKSASITDVRAALTRMGAAVKRNKDKIKQKTMETTGVALGAVGGGLAGFFMGGRAAAIEKDTTIVGDAAKEEAMKIMGYVDPDLAGGLVLAGLGLAGVGGKKSAGALLFAGSGVLAYWSGSKAFDLAKARAYGEGFEKQGRIY